MRISDIDNFINSSTARTSFDIRPKNALRKIIINTYNRQLNRFEFAMAAINSMYFLR